MAEKTVGVSELKTHLSQYLRQVKVGHTILITERGKVIGRIMPPEMKLEDKLDSLRRAGIIRGCGKKLKPIEPVALQKDAGSLATLINQGRR